jgi:hypothetical protein
MFQCDPFPRNRSDAGDEGEGDKALTTDPLMLGAIPNHSREQVMERLLIPFGQGARWIAHAAWVT